jgi:hypothetical protein
VAGQELKLWETEEQDDLRIERELEALVSRESNLNSRVATLAAERKDLEETHAVVLARELAADVRDSGLNSREELADREKRLAERKQQLVGRSSRSWLPLAAGWRSSRQPGQVMHRKSGISWARPRLHWCPLVSDASASGILWRRSVPRSHFLTPHEPRC